MERASFNYVENTEISVEMKSIILPASFETKDQLIERLVKKRRQLENNEMQECGCSDGD